MGWENDVTTLETWLLDQCQFIKDSVGVNDYYFKLADGVAERITVFKKEPTRKQIEAIVRGASDCRKLNRRLNVESDDVVDETQSELCYDRD